jgi:hypothetical protein
MTIKEALTSTINFTLPDSRIEKALIDAGLDGTTDYAQTNERAVDFCFAGLLFTLITSANLKEDDILIYLPQRDQLIAIYSAIYKKWGLRDPLLPAVPVIRRSLRFW